MSDAHEIVNQNINKRNSNNNELHDKNVYDRNLIFGDSVLMKNLYERGGTGKLRTKRFTNITSST